MVSGDPIRLCAVCGEDAILVTSGGKHLVRVRRTSKCKATKRRNGQLCKTDIGTSERAVVTEWNRRFA